MCKRTFFVRTTRAHSLITFDAKYVYAYTRLQMCRCVYTHAQVYILIHTCHLLMKSLHIRSLHMCAYMFQTRIYI